jgi:hypothetical protein
MSRRSGIRFADKDMRQREIHGHGFRQHRRHSYFVVQGTLPSLPDCSEQFSQEVIMNGIIYLVGLVVVVLAVLAFFGLH